MTDDWKPGDLALCVNNRRRLDVDGRWAVAGDRLRAGAIYTVASVAQVDSMGGSVCGPFLYLREDASGHSCAAWRFRKIRPHEADEFDSEVIELLNAKPQRLDALLPASVERVL